jgi:prepilin-type processing-associated H-X9-DG protein
MGGYAADHDGRLNWEYWPSIGNDPLTYSPYVSYWTGDSEDRSGFAMQLKQRCCPAVKWNSRVSNSPVTYATIQPVGVTKVGITGRINGLSSDYPLSRIKNHARFMLMIDALSSGSYSISTREDFIARVKPLTLRGPNLRHSNSVNALFADYSVREMSWNEIEKGLKYWTTF